MPYVILLVVLGLVTYRATRLVVDDEFPPIRAAREWVIGLQRRRSRWNAPGDVIRLRGYKVVEALGDLVSCRYCASGWVSLAVTCVSWVWLPNGVPAPPLTWFAVWGLGVIIYNYEDPTAERSHGVEHSGHVNVQGLSTDDHGAVAGWVIEPKASVKDS